jgi:hypothetical protein
MESRIHYTTLGSPANPLVNATSILERRVHGTLQVTIGSLHATSPTFRIVM